MGASRYAISLRVFHPSIDPDDISAILGIAPKRAFKAGLPRTAPSGKLLPGINDQTFWTARLHESGDPLGALADSIKDISDRLALHRAFLQRIRSEGGRCELFIGWFLDEQVGEVFPHTLLEQLGALGIDLSFDVYGGPDEGDVQDP